MCFAPDNFDAERNKKKKKKQRRVCFHTIRTHSSRGVSAVAEFFFSSSSIRFDFYAAFFRSAHPFCLSFSARYSARAQGRMRFHCFDGNSAVRCWAALSEHCSCIYFNLANERDGWRVTLYDSCHRAFEIFFSPLRGMYFIALIKQIFMKMILDTLIQALQDAQGIGKTSPEKTARKTKICKPTRERLIFQRALHYQPSVGGYIASDIRRSGCTAKLGE